MDNAQKAIMIGVGLFITIIIISAVLLITNIGTGMVNSSREQLSGISKGLQNQVTSAYDGKTMTGSEVIAAFTMYESSEMSIVVCTNKTTGANATAYTGKYKLDWANIQTAKTGGSTLGSDASYAGGVYYTGTDLNQFANDKTSLTALQSTATGGYKVNASQTYYSSIIKDAATDTVIGIAFVRAGS